ncbi:amino acid permease [Acidianus sulfidivorans JP7]|uniref:Amino acid permease n=1 Tax=Acidianus sulfidivorans JP7 TaxID=619593 RepID=A0A2U9IND9_9CREN|nr:APC family permease [Acidianus sulfidivorans]AWR97531.1 amino acid permease [Acidianus sulfidivorans JP7]
MKLSKSSISLKETYGQAMAVTAPLGSVVSTTTAAITYVGYSVVFTTILALLGSALWIYTLTRYTSKVASAGGYYTFGYSAWKNKTVSFYEAILEAFAYSFLNAVNAIAIYLLLSVALSMYGIVLSPFYEGLIISIGILYPTLISLTHIRFVLGKVVSISATAEALLLISLFAFSLTRGFHISYLAPSSNIPIYDLAAAFVLSMVSISGAGSSTYLGEETKKPLQNISKGMWLALSIGGISMVLGTYALVSLWNGSISSLSNSSQPLIAEAFKFGVIPLIIVLILSVNSLLSSNIGTTLGSARILFNLARENAAPSIFSKVNKKNEPIIATLIIGTITASVAVAAILSVGVNAAFSDISLITGIIWLSGRIIDGAGVPFLYYRIGQLRPLELIIPLAATGINLWGVTESLAVPDVFTSTLVIILISLSIVWYLLKGRKGKPGSLVVDENNEITTIDEYLQKLKRKKEASIT